MTREQVSAETHGFSALWDNVVSKGLCTECGVCVSACPTQRIALRYVDEEPEPYLAKPDCPRHCRLCSEVCPGKDVPMLALEKKAFGASRNVAVDKFGVYRKAFQSCAADPEIRARSASGGSTTAMLSYVLDKGIVDAAIVAGYDEQLPYRPVGKIVTDSSKLIQYARSKHGGSPPIDALLHTAVVEMGIDRLAIVGCPCHIHGIRKVQSLNTPRKIAQSIKIAFGLFCGTQFSFEGIRHLLFEWCGVKSLDEIEMIDYRWGDWPGGFYVKTKDGREVLMDRYAYVYNVLYPGGWQRHRCTMCLDHDAELADVAFGDYWHADRKAGTAGWNMTVARSDIGLEVVNAAARDGYLEIHDADLRDQPWSGIEMKKHGSAFRHKTRERYGVAVPDYGFSLPHDPEEPRRLPVMMPSFGQPFLKLR